MHDMYPKRMSLGSRECMHDMYPKRMSLGSRDLFKFWEIGRKQKR